MAVVDNIVYDELAFVHTTNVRSFRCQLTGATSTITSGEHRFGISINTCVISVEGTNTITWTRSGTTITVTGTNDNYINVIVTGR